MGTLSIQAEEYQKLKTKIAELEGESAIDKSKLLNHIRWLNEANTKIADLEAEMRTVATYMNEWFYHYVGEISDDGKEYYVDLMNRLRGKE